MLLLSVVALVEDQQLEGRQLDESVPQDVQQDLRRADDAVAVLELVLPGLVVEPVAAVLAAVFADAQLRVDPDHLRLLEHERHAGDQERHHLVLQGRLRALLLIFQDWRPSGHTPHDAHHFIWPRRLPPRVAHAAPA